jgi:hypothetical protein
MTGSYERQLKLYVRDMNEETARKKRKAAGVAMIDDAGLRDRVVAALAESELTSLKLIAASERIMRLEQALRPFAEAADVFAREYPAMLDKPGTSCGIRFDALQAAREALTHP